jgi:hypothetical protein
MKKFESFGEFCRAAFRAQQMPGAFEDARLVRAPTGAGEVDPSGSGFLVDPEFADRLIGSPYEESVLAPLCTEISSNPRGVKLPAIDEISRANGSRWGGVASAWLGGRREPGGELAQIPAHGIFAAKIGRDLRRD